MASVKQAIKESVEAFVRGVHSHSQANPDVTIPDKIVKWLQDHNDVKKSFEKQLGSNPDKWEVDGPRVCTAAFHAGSLASFHAYANDPKVVNEVHVKAALEHISDVCEVRLGVRWVYCPWLPGPKSRIDS